MKKRRLILTCLMLLCSLFTYAQSIKLSGIVTQEGRDEPLAFASIAVENTSQGTTANADGSYSIEVQSGNTLIFSFMGMISKQVEVTGSSDAIINVTLVPDSETLEEVVVVGYGTSRKRDITGSIVSIDGEDIKNTPTMNPISGLQGRVPGLSIVATGGAGSNPDVKIRGIGSLYSGTGPLYVVDGIFVSDIGYLNSNDIESIDVLKDASSLAIFGVQGANGVIIVTTTDPSKGREAGSYVSYDGYVGIQNIAQSDRVDLTNASEFTALYNEYLKNRATDLGAAYTPWQGDLLGGGTNWVDQILRAAIVTNHSVKVGKSSDRGSSLLGIGYFKQDGVHKTDSYERYTVQLKADTKIKNWLTVGANVTLNNGYRDLYGNAFSSAMKALPTYAPLDGGQSEYDKSFSFDGNPGEIFSSPPVEQATQVTNPVSIYEIQDGTGKVVDLRAVASGYVSANFAKHFTYKTAVYADVYMSETQDYNPSYLVGGRTEAPRSNFTRKSAKNAAYQVDNTLTFDYTEKADHRINAVVGMTYREVENSGFSASRDSITNVPNVDPSLWMLISGHEKYDDNSDYYGKEAFISYLGRVGYTYKDRYIVNVTLRVDGSSKFGPDSRWGVFPAVGIAWIASEEDFINIPYLKLKASWGRIGNDKIGNYLYFPTINPQGNTIVIDGEIVHIPTVDTYVDSNIRWEVVEGIDVGVETRLFNNSLSLEFGYFNKTTKDLLAYVPAPATSIAPSGITNAGSMRNSGVEFLASQYFNVGDFNFTVSANASYLRNRVLSLGNDNTDIISGDNIFRTSVGQPIGSMYGYKMEGVFQNQDEIDAAPTQDGVKPGDIRYADLNNDGKITDKDRTYIGNYMPDFEYGISLNANYRDFGLSINFAGVEGVDIYSTVKMPSTYALFNYSAEKLNRWHGEGTSYTEPILSDRSNNTLPSSYYVESGDYFRVRNIQFSYNFPQAFLQKIGINRARVYLNAENPFTWHQYIGWTPEVGGNLLTRGYDKDNNKYPIASVYTIGLSFDF